MKKITNLWLVLFISTALFSQNAVLSALEQFKTEHEQNQASSNEIDAERILAERIAADSHLSLEADKSPNLVAGLDLADAVVATMYCDATTGTEDEWIANVLCGDINNSSGWQGGVADYTNITTTIAAGEAANIVVTNGNAYNYDRVTCWVDWNSDTVFEQASAEEFVLLNVDGAGETFTGEIVAPIGTPNGDYRMRIRMTYNSDPLPCGYATYGEVEDYTISVFTGNDNDLGIMAIVEPVSGYQLTSAEPVTITIKNFGEVAQSNFDVSFNRGTDVLVVETVIGTLEPGATTDYTFTATANLSAIGTYFIDACTMLPGDQNPDNDCKTAEVVNQQYAKITGSVATNATPPVPIGGALIEAGGFSTYSVATTYGSYYNPFLPPGTYNVTCSYAGYLSQTVMDVTCDVGAPGVADFALVPGVAQPLPFLEDWDSGLYETNAWTFDPDQGNWKMELPSDADPEMPWAEFDWTPGLEFYDYALVSTSFDGTSAVNNISLRYDLYLDNYSSATLETMVVEVFDGTDWTTIFTHDNVSGDIPWTNFNWDITQYALGNPQFKVRFRAVGEDSYNINRWWIDNIYVSEGQYATVSGILS